MKITIYTTSSCPFCKQEKDYLKTNNIAFLEKNIEEHREFLSEMLQVSNNFAGVPFTEVIKDNNSKIYLKGFTKEDFDKELGIKVSEAAVVGPTSASAISIPIVEPIKPIEPVVSPTPTPVVESPTTPMEQPIATMPTEPIKTESVIASPTPIPIVEPIKPIEPVVSPTPTPVVESQQTSTQSINDELKSVLESLEGMTGEKNEPKVASVPNVAVTPTSSVQSNNSTSVPSIPDFPGK